MSVVSDYEPAWDDDFEDVSSGARSNSSTTERSNDDTIPDSDLEAELEAEREREEARREDASSGCEGDYDLDQRIREGWNEFNQTDPSALELLRREAQLPVIRARIHDTHRRRMLIPATFLVRTNWIYRDGVLVEPVSIFARDPIHNRLLREEQALIYWYYHLKWACARHRAWLEHHFCQQNDHTYAEFVILIYGPGAGEREYTREIRDQVARHFWQYEALGEGHTQQIRDAFIEEIITELGIHPEGLPDPDTLLDALGSEFSEMESLPETVDLDDSPSLDAASAGGDTVSLGDTDPFPYLPDIHGHDTVSLPDTEPFDTESASEHSFHTAHSPSVHSHTSGADDPPPPRPDDDQEGHCGTTGGPQPDTPNPEPTPPTQVPFWGRWFVTVVEALGVDFDDLAEYSRSRGADYAHSDSHDSLDSED